MIENFRKNVNITAIGRFSGETYMGEFTFKVSLSPMDLINADRYYRELLGGNPIMATSEAQQMAFSLAQLKYRVLKHPSWWEEVTKIDSVFFDYNILTEVLTKALEVEEEFRAEVDARLKQAQERIGKVIRKKYNDPDPEEAEEEEDGEN